MSQVEEELFSRNSLRKALKQWDNTGYLRNHPLVNLQIVHERIRQDKASFPNTPAGRGIALRQILYEAIQAMKPTSTDFDYANPAWRRYTILHEQYIQKRQAKAICDTLIISPSSYFLEQGHALDWLGNHLRDREETIQNRFRLTGPSELPAYPLPFIGREHELSRIAELLTLPECRLLTIIGPGGIGKTRLAVEASRQAFGGWPDGIFFVPLTQIESIPSFVLALAQALQVSLMTGDEPQQQMLNFLQNKRLLFILDNCENLLGGNSFVKEMLTQAPGIKILATSRKKLGLNDEWLFPLSGMVYPDVTAKQLIESESAEFEAFSAVKLFLLVVQRGRANAILPEAEKPHILRICQLLGGLPLGIEMAAAWSQFISCQEIARKLEDGLDLFHHPAQDVANRHQSLHVVFNSSWEQLSEMEKMAISKLIVFHGRFDSRAAHAVADASLSQLQLLVDKSFLQASWGVYDIHPVWRQFIKTKAGQQPQIQEQAERAHCYYYLTFLRDRSDALKKGNQLAAIEEIDACLENIRFAWEWAIGHQMETVVLSAMEALYLFHELSFRYREGLAWFGHDAARETWFTNTAGIWGMSLGIRGRFYMALDEEESAHACFLKAINILETANLPDPLAFVSMLAVQADLPSPYQSDHLFAACWQYYSQHNDQWALANTTFLRAIFMIFRSSRENRLEEAHQLMRQSLVIFQEIGDQWGISNAYHYLAGIALIAGRYGEARSFAEQSLGVRRDIRNWQGAVYTLSVLGQISMACHEMEVARHYFEKAKALAVDIGNPRLIAEVVNLGPLS